MKRNEKEKKKDGEKGKAQTDEADALVPASHVCRAFLRMRIGIGGGGQP